MPRIPLVAACCLLGLGTAPALAATHDWSRFGFDAARSNFSTAVAGIRASDLAHLTRPDVTVPGTVDSSPIYLHAVQVKGKKRDVFIATTSYGRTFALDARNGHRLWTFSPPSIGSLQGSYRITHSSPIADRASGFVYAASPDGKVRKISIASGKQVVSGSWPVRITRLPSHEKIGTALNLSGNNLIATTGGYTGDAPPYQGHVVLIDKGSGKIVRVFNALCSNRRGLIDPSTCSETGSAIWARSGAVVVPGTGQILVATGDGNFNGHSNWGDSVLELTSDLKHLVGNWTPSDESRSTPGTSTSAPPRRPCSRSAAGGWRSRVARTRSCACSTWAT